MNHKAKAFDLRGGKSEKIMTIPKYQDDKGFSWSDHISATG